MKIYARHLINSSIGKLEIAQSYVDKVKLLDYWKLQDAALAREFARSKFLVMIDRKLIVEKKNKDLRIVQHDNESLKKTLGDYGLTFDMSNSCLLDAVESQNELVPLFGTAITAADPPDDSPVNKKQVMAELAKDLGGELISVRMAMLTMNDEKQRSLLARFQSLTNWHTIYRRCPKCAQALKMRASKSGAQCVPCQRIYYPHFSPVTITLVTDVTNQNLLLVRHRGSINGVFTNVAGFSEVGESLVECARREIAEELGLETLEIDSLNLSQAWPMPDSSLMVAHIAKVDMDQKISICPDELETAKWFTRAEVAAALKKTEADPFLKNLPTTLEERQVLHYIPPQGAIAHTMIKNWVNGLYDDRFASKL